MAKFLNISSIVLIGTFLITSCFIGCTPKPSTEEMGKLEEARAAAESAERKLSDLRMERMQLEKDLNGTEGAAQGEEQELEEIQDEQGAE